MLQPDGNLPAEDLHRIINDNFNRAKPVWGLETACKMAIAFIESGGTVAEVETRTAAQAVKDKRLADLEAHASKAQCIWCGHMGEKAGDDMLAHVQECPVGPLRALLKIHEELAGFFERLDARAKEIVKR